MGACARFSLSRFLFVHFVIWFFRRSDVWHLEVAVLEDPSLRSLVPDLLDFSADGISGLVHRNQVQVGLV